MILKMLDFFELVNLFYKLTLAPGFPGSPVSPSLPGIPWYEDNDNNKIKNKGNWYGKNIFIFP